MRPLVAAAVLAFAAALMTGQSIGPTPALANDPVERSAGGLSLTPQANDQIEIRQEKLYISMDRVLVDYTFHNHAKNDHEITLSFPMPVVKAPRAQAGTAAHPDQGDDFTRNFMNFSVQVAGQSIQPQLTQQALLDGVEVTDRLEQAGLPLNPLTAAQAIAHLPPLTRDALSDLIGAGDLPLWELQGTYSWAQRFPAGQDLRISHSYRPMLGAAPMMAIDFLHPETRFDRFCADRRFLHAGQMMAEKAGPEAAIMGQFMTYQLQSGRAGQGPIGRFVLTVDKPDAKTLVSFCGKPVRKLSATRFQIEARNFDPAKDLHILWLRPTVPH